MTTQILSKKLNAVTLKSPVFVLVFQTNYAIIIGIRKMGIAHGGAERAQRQNPSRTRAAGGAIP
jgi:hypothetical protein